MAQDFIRREEFSSEIRNLREELKDDSIRLADAISTGFDKVAETAKDSEEQWRQRTHDLADKMNGMDLRQAVHTKVTEAGFAGINNRLDKLNGQVETQRRKLESHETRLVLQEAKVGTLSPKAKVAVAAGGGVSLLAVLHSLFEMVRAIGPSITTLFVHSK